MKSKAKSETKPRRQSAARLSPFVSPTDIELHFELDPVERDFRGRANYCLRIEKRTRKLEIHAADLRVSNARLHLGDDVSKARVEAKPESETIVLHFDRLLPIDSIRLTLDFRGRVRNDLRGLYRSTDKKHPWLATQLCPTDARRFFPSFDEPGIKARYRISVTTEAAQTVLSNSPIESEEVSKNGRKTVQFETTPLLSAYLIAVAVGPFVASPTHMSGDTPIRVFALPGREKLVAFALETACANLARLEQWFDMAHPYAKLDLVALPDFAFGAMENAGAVFFRDSVLLLDALKASLEDRKRAAETITHEISHMWFGNLVTMAWWNDLWLNESFATWMAYEIIEGWRPEWRIWLDFAHRRESALEVDALASSHPIAPKIRSAQEAHENFDAITYTKGACVLRMLEGFMGAEKFRDGIRLYMRRHRDGAATASDLWAALAETSGLRIEALVAPWTLQTGYPLVSLQRKKRQGIDSIELTQERFFARRPRSKSKHQARQAAAKSKPVRWQIPWVGVSGRRSGGEPRTTNHLFVKLRDHVPASASQTTWIYGNARDAGFFRVAHGVREQEDLIAHLPELSPPERIGFVGHQWALTRAGRIPIASLLELVGALGDDEDPDVLSAAAGVLERLSQRLVANRKANVQADFRRWIASRFGGQIDQVGLNVRSGENALERMRRAQLFRIVGGLAFDERIRRVCEKRCESYFSRGRALPNELADVTIRIAASNGDERLHHLLVEATRDATTPQERRRMLFALSEFNQPDLLEKSLNAGLDANLAPAPDRALLLATLLSRPASALTTWNHLKKSWRRLEKEMPPILLARLAGSTAEALPFSTISDVRDFFKRRPLAAGSRVLRQVAEEIAISKRFDDEAGTPLAEYLVEH